MKKYIICLAVIFMFLLQCKRQNKALIPSVQIIEFQTNTTASIRGLFVVNKNIIWASGSQGTILKTIDGGKIWQTIQIPGGKENDFRSIFAWNEKRAIVFGVSGPDFGYLTEDSGITWQVIFRDSTEGLFFNSLKFADNNIGLAVSDQIDKKPFLIKTSDGGKSWKQIQNIPDALIGEANFAASNTCIEFLPSGKAWIATGGSTARTFYSSDFGESWEVFETPITSGKSASGIFSICFKNDSVGGIVGGTYDNPELNNNIAAYTNDGGKSWQSSKIMPKEYRSCVQYISRGNDSFFFAVGKTGCDISSDNGKTWSFVKKLDYYTFKFIPGQLSGIFAGKNGRIANAEIVF